MRACAVHVFAFLFVVAAESQAQRPREVGVDLFGVSWHYSSDTYFDGVETRRYQGRNLGAGLHVTLGERGRHVWMLKAGGYEDSMYNQSWYAGPVWQYRVIGGLRAGAGVLLFDSDSYVTPVIPLPLVTYRAGGLGLNMTWVPAGNSEASGALAFFGTLVLWREP
ncbi:MAG: hypothetical protein KF895_15710 [Parvibaculum sp.]|nr:hypothetical protein [Parvibaculum sp.]